MSTLNPEPEELSDEEMCHALDLGVKPESKHWLPPTVEKLQELMPGYVIQKLLGRGGMGAVYRGVQTSLDRVVAIKILPPGLEELDPTFVERFKNEAKVMAKLDHPNIVSIYECGETAGGQLYFVMEFVDGTDVSRLIGQQGKLPPEQARSITIEVCEALAAAHSLGIVHRDIKPANVLINTKDQVKVADFGLARLPEAVAQGLTRTGYAVGTPDFLAPEVLTAGSIVDARADVYALGVMLYQMLTGHLPRGAFKSASEHVPGLHPRFDDIILKAMQAMPADRYASATELRRDLKLMTSLAAVPTLREADASTVLVPVAKEPTLVVPTVSEPPTVRRQKSTTTARTSGMVKKVPLKGNQAWSTERRTRLVTALIGVLLTFSMGYLALKRVGGGLAMLSYDVPFFVQPARAVNEVRAVYLEEFDGEFLDRSGQARLLDKLGEAGARAVMYDVVFDRPSADPAVDTAFAAAIRRFRGVDATGAAIPGARQRVVLLACGRKNLEQAGVIGEQLIPPTDTLMDAATDFGLVTLLHDDTFTVRELATGTPDEATITWKLAQSLVSKAKLSDESRLQPRWINFAGPPSTIPSLMARDVISSVEPELLRDKVIVVGGKPGIVSPKLGEDTFSTPYHSFDSRGNLALMSGVEVQANVLSNLSQGNWLTRSSHHADLWMISAMALVFGFGLTRMRPLFGLLFGILAVVALVLSGIISVHFGNVWFPWSVAALAQLPVALVWGTAAHFYVERFFRMKLTEEQKKLREAFERYLSPGMLERVTTEDFHLKTGGDKVLAAMMFTDIAAFTDACQRVRDPELIVENLNGYFERTTSHVFDHDGMVIKFIGDAIFAAWGVPFEDEHAAVKCVRAAWNLSEHAKLKMDGEDLLTRVGLHYGEVVAGNIGSKRHVDYTLIGDAVNLAARLEGMNKMLGTGILLSEAVQQHLSEEFITRRVGQFRVKGRQDVTTVYELLGPATQTDLPAWAEQYHAALAAFESSDNSKARRLFNQVNQSRMRGDGPSQFFLEVLSKGETTLAGVVDLKEK